jgi:hypothetical protein
MEESQNINKIDLDSLTEEERARIREYQNIHTRLRILKAQMAEIQDEAHDLTETLEKMRIKDKNKDNG